MDAAAPFAGLNKLLNATDFGFMLGVGAGLNDIFKLVSALVLSLAVAVEALIIEGIV